MFNLSRDFLIMLSLCLHCNLYGLLIYLCSCVCSVTSKKLPNVYKSCLKRIYLVKWKIVTPLQKLPKMCWWFGQNNYCPGLWKVAQSIKKSPNLVTLLVPQIYCNKGKSSYHHRVLLQKVTSELKSNTLIQSDFIVNDIFWEIDDYCLKR